jgi:tetratricopeptide (TPR) repeat protein
MSLVYRALRQAQAHCSANASRPVPTVVVDRRAAPRWWLRLGVPAGALLGFLVAFAVSVPREGVAAVETRPLADEAPAAAATAPAPTVPAVAPEPVPHAPVRSDSRRTPDGTREIRIAPAPVSTAIPEIPAPAALPTGSIVRHASRPAGKSAPADDEAATAAAVAAFSAAMKAGHADEARNRLARLSGLLPPQSLTLLRMRAWYASETGAGDAEQLYLQIIDRVPDDANASVNLALLRSRAGDVAGARQLLEKLRARSPESPGVDAAWRQLETMQP